jgi:hypothetical protein
MGAAEVGGVRLPVTEMVTNPRRTSIRACREPKRPCAIYSGFKIQDGRLASFLVDRKRVGSRMTSSSESDDSLAGADIQVRSAYSAPRGGLTIAVEVVLPFMPVTVMRALYRGPGETKSVLATSPTFPIHVPSADLIIPLAFEFPKQKLGGELKLQGYPSRLGGSTESVSFAIG